jgi:hypothetical protein
MKTIKRNLTVSITIALISVLSISIGATVIRNTNSTHKKYYSRPAIEKETSLRAGIIKYDGELIPLVQLPEVIISDTAIQKKK